MVVHTFKSQLLGDRVRRISKWEVSLGHRKFQDSQVYRETLSQKTQETQDPVYEVTICLFLDKVFLYHPWHLPEPCNNEGHCRVCRGQGAGQAAILPEAHGA